jgi:hypothetical protein
VRGGSGGRLLLMMMTRRSSESRNSESRKGGAWEGSMSLGSTCRCEDMRRVYYLGLHTCIIASFQHSMSYRVGRWCSLI